MADNVQLSPGFGGDVVAADDIAGTKYQRVKIAVGSDGNYDGDASTATPLPVHDVTADILQTLMEEIKASNEMNQYLLQALLEKTARLDTTDRPYVNISDYGIGGSAFVASIVNATSNPVSGAVYYRTQEPWNFSDTGSARIYQQILVS